MYSHNIIVQVRLFEYLLKHNNSAFCTWRVVPEEDRGHGDENEPNDFVGWELHATVRASLDDDFSL